MKRPIASELTRVTTALLAEVFGSKPAAYPARVLDAAERRLGVRLPTVLRAYYAVAGRHRACGSGALHPLVPPKSLELAGAGVVFMEENQNVAFYGVKREHLELEDPPVFQGNPDEAEWYAECPRLSSFLVKSLCWQATQFLSSDVAFASAAAWRRATRGFERVECGAPLKYDADVRRRDALVAIAFADRGDRKVYVASRSPEAVSHLVSQLRAT